MREKEKGTGLTKDAKPLFKAISQLLCPVQMFEEGKFEYELWEWRLEGAGSSEETDQ